MLGRQHAKLTYPALELYVRSRRAGGAAAATIRFELAVLSQAFKVARKRGVIASAPLFPTVPVRNVRTEHFTDAQLDRLLAELPDYLDPVVRFAAATGWLSSGPGPA